MGDSFVFGSEVSYLEIRCGSLDIHCKAFYSFLYFIYASWFSIACMLSTS